MMAENLRKSALHWSPQGTVRRRKRRRGKPTYTWETRRPIESIMGARVLEGESSVGEEIAVETEDDKHRKGYC
jgi:hypothetical protein